ncbi:hypothetical protein FQZ97_976000 [compost metagenome]
MITASRGDEGQADAGIARGRLDDAHAGLEQAALLGIPDHAGTDPALHRISRVTSFDLGQYGDARRAEAVDLDQRGVADGLCVVCEDAAHGGVLVLGGRKKALKPMMPRPARPARRNPVRDTSRLR